jgi:hypothetical protein
MQKSSDVVASLVVCLSAQRVPKLEDDRELLFGRQFVGCFDCGGGIEALRGKYRLVEWVKVKPPQLF